MFTEVSQTGLLWKPNLSGVAYHPSASPSQKLSGHLIMKNIIERFP